MNTHVNVFAADWCDLVFESKNKEYGAFELRQMSAKRHAIAIFLSIALFGLAVSAPVLIRVFTPALKIKIDDKVELSRVVIDQPEAVKPLELLPPPKLRSQIQFTPPVITNEQIEQQTTPIMDELLNSTVAIGSHTVNGVDDPDAVFENELAGKKITEEVEVAIFVEQMPVFPGGDQARIKFLKDHINYPSVAAEMGITGRVILQFVVDAKGKIDKIKVLRGIGGGCDEEAVRVAKLMPPWTPGRQNGKAVPVYFTFPIVFTLANQ